MLLPRFQQSGPNGQTFLGVWPFAFESSYRSFSNGAEDTISRADRVYKPLHVVF